MNHRASAQIPQALGWRRGDGRAWRVVEFLLAKKRLTNGGESPPAPARTIKASRLGDVWHRPGCFKMMQRGFGFYSFRASMPRRFKSRAYIATVRPCQSTSTVWFPGLGFSTSSTMSPAGIGTITRVPSWSAIASVGFSSLKRFPVSMAVSVLHPE